MNATVTPRLEAAFGALPLAEYPLWTNLTDRLRSASTNSQLGQEGTADFLLDNRDRALEPEYAASPYYPNVVPNLRMRLVAGTNLLDYETSTAEGGMGASSAWNGTATIGRFYDATDGWGFTITGNGAGFPSMITGGPTYDTVDIATATPVTAGQSYRVMGQFKPVTTARTFAGLVDWYTSAGAHIFVAGAGSGTEVLGQWTQLSGTVTAPALAAYARVGWQISSGAVAVGEVHRVRSLALFPSTITTWSPGYTIPFDGYVDKIIPGYTFGPAGGGDAVVAVRCTDLTKILARYPTRPPYETAMRAAAPRHWWRLGEQLGATVMNDSGSSPSHGIYSGSAVLGSTPVAYGTKATSMHLRQGADGSEALFPEISGDFTFEGLVRSPADTHADAFGLRAALIYGGPDGYDTIDVTVTIATGGDAVMHCHIFSRLLLSVLQVDSVRLAPSMPTHWAVRRSGNTFGFYVNGVLVGQNTIAALMSLSGLRVGWGTNLGLSGDVGEIAAYPSALAPSVFVDHTAAARTPWAGDSTGSRVARVLTSAGVPVSMHDVDTGATVGLGPQLDAVEDLSALDLLRKAEETEFARMFGAGGQWVFRNRRSLDGTAAVAVFGDGGGTEIPYSDLVEDFSEDHLVRTATVTRQGGNPQTYTDPAATAADATFGEKKDGLLYATDGEAYDAAAYMVNQGKDPALRFEAVTLQGERSQTVMRQVAARKIGDKVTVRRRPPGGGAVQEKTVVVEGVAHSIDLQAPTWRATYRLAPTDTVGYWKLEDALLGQLDSTTVLAF